MNRIRKAALFGAALLLSAFAITPPAYACCRPCAGYCGPGVPAGAFCCSGVPEPGNACGFTTCGEWGG
ncbi:MAG TPA: hypothetical protein VF789_23155 [Thermoanaerobaculia bacterium]